MLWFIYALAAAIGNAVKDAMRKGVLRDCDEYSLAFSVMAITSLALLPVAIWQGLPDIAPNFFLVLILSTASITTAQLLILKALRSSDLSLCSPMLAFSPIVLLISSPLILGEYPSMIGIAGVLLIVAGAYSLNISKMKEGILSPFKHLVKDKGPRFFLIVAVIFGVSANFDRLGIGSSSPVFWLFSVNALSAFVLFFILLSRKDHRTQMRKAWGMGKYVVLVGVLNAVLLVFQMNAIMLAQVPYVISVKRTSAIFGVIIGALYFKEKGFRERLAGAIIMVAGVVLIAFS